jgi:hypothetical protein
MKDVTAIIALLCALAGAACGGSGMRLRPKGDAAATDASPSADSPDAGYADVPMDHQRVADLAFYADTTSQADGVFFTDTASDTGAAAFDVGAPASCAWRGNSIAPGKFVNADDACNVCQCRSDGTMACTTDACPPAFDALPSLCTLGSELWFGVIGTGACGGNVRIDMFTLNATNQITVNRVYNGCGIDNQHVRSCTAPLPVCGAEGVVSLATIAQDLSRSEVKAAFAAGDSSIYGWSLGNVWSISQEGGGRIRVGGDCPPQATDVCLAPPVGIARLANDLASLASDALVSAACAGL